MKRTILPRGLSLSLCGFALCSGYVYKGTMNEKVRVKRALSWLSTPSFPGYSGTVFGALDSHFTRGGAELNVGVAAGLGFNSTHSLRGRTMAIVFARL